MFLNLLNVGFLRMFDIDLYLKLTRKLGNNCHSAENCWEFIHSLNNKGYGRVRWKLRGQTKAKNYYAHRLMWIAVHGPSFDKPFVCHKCDNPKCINPYHLFLGTNRDNFIDCLRKGRRDCKEIAKKYSGELHHKAKLTVDEVKNIKSMFQSGLRICEIRRSLGLHKQTVYRICRNISWKQVR